LLEVLKMGRVAVQNPTAEQLPDEKQAGRRVLIVDHDENVLIALKRLLEEARYNTTTAQGGLKALQLLRQGAFDLVLLDDHLPDVSGEEVVRQVRSASAGTPVVVVQSDMRVSVRVSSSTGAIQKQSQNSCTITSRGLGFCALTS
jgi:CheY-like chemotaxis protein